MNLFLCLPFIHPLPFVWCSFPDLCLCLYYRQALFNTLTILHHVLIITAFLLGVYSRVGTYYMSSMLLNEISTLFLNLNYFLAASKSYHNGAVYKINAVLLLLTFFLARVVFNLCSLSHLFSTWSELAHVYFFRLTLRLQLTAVLLSSLATAHVLLNLAWFVAVCNAVRRKFSRP